MPVAIERRLDGGVAELRLDVLGMGALRDDQAGVRVAQVVEADPPVARAMWGEPSAIRVARCAKFGRSMSAMASADNGVGMDTLLGISMGCRRKADLKPKLKGSCRTLTPREREDPAGGLDELMAVPRRSRWEPTLSVFPNQLRVGDRFTDAEGEWEVASRPVGFKQGHEVRARVRRLGAPGLRHGARIGAEALRDQAADFVELDALADRLQRGQGDDRASHAGGVRVLRVSVIDD